MPCHAIPKGGVFTTAYYLRNIRTNIVARRAERGERRLVVYADNARSDTGVATRTVCNNYFLWIALHSPYSPDLAPSDFFLFSCLEISKAASEDSNSGLQMNFFRESEKIWTKSALTLLKPFFGSGSAEWTDALQYCRKWKVHAMKQTMVHWVILDSAQIWRRWSHRGTSDNYILQAIHFASNSQMLSRRRNCWEWVALWIFTMAWPDDEKFRLENPSISSCRGKVSFHVTFFA
jgi:hypothetical protein